MSRVAYLGKIVERSKYSKSSGRKKNACVYVFNLHAYIADYLVHLQHGLQ